MGIRARIKAFMHPGREKSTSESLESWKSLAQFLGLDEDMPQDAMAEATYYTCIKVLRESIGRMPLSLMRETGDGGVVKESGTALAHVVGTRPNRFCDATSFWAGVEQCRNHYGNAFVYVKGAGTERAPLSLWLMPNKEVEVWYESTPYVDTLPDVYYIWRHGGGERVLKSRQVLHFKSSDTFDGIKGVPLIDRLGGIVDGGKEAQAFQNKLIASGMTGKAVLQYTGQIDGESEKLFSSNISAFMKNEYSETAGVKDVIPIPVGTTLQPLNLKLSDAQFQELKKYSAIQIASAFGIKPQQIGDMMKTSYASSQAQNEAFYVDTLLYIVKGYEDELNAKLLTDEQRASGLFFEFDTSTTLRSSFSNTVETLREAVNNGLMSHAEARSMLNLPAQPPTGELLVQGAMIPLAMAGAQYASETAPEGGEER